MFGRIAFCLGALQRHVPQLDETRLPAQLAPARTIAETELQIVQVDRDLASEVGKELRETDARIGEFVERKVARRTSSSPSTSAHGTVHQSAVHTVGGAVANGEAILLIVPDADSLMVEVKVAPHEIDQLRLGQNAILRFTAFHQRKTPEINGTVNRIAADANVDQRTGASYFTIRIGLAGEEVARLGDVKLVPGMPVEAFIQTGDRKVLSYLAKPLHNQIMRAFRDKDSGSARSWGWPEDRGAQAS